MGIPASKPKLEVTDADIAKVIAERIKFENRTLRSTSVGGDESGNIVASVEDDEILGTGIDEGGYNGNDDSLLGGQSVGYDSTEEDGADWDLGMQLAFRDFSELPETPVNPSAEPLEPLPNIWGPVFYSDVNKHLKSGEDESNTRVFYWVADDPRHVQVQPGSKSELLLLLKESFLTETEITAEMLAHGFITTSQSPRRVNTMWRLQKKAWKRYQENSGDPSRQVLLPSMHGRPVQLLTLQDRAASMQAWRELQRKRGPKMSPRQMVLGLEAQGRAWNMVLSETDRCGRVMHRGDRGRGELTMPNWKEMEEE